jgi:capsular polysaccharide biosynthesis protein
MTFFALFRRISDMINIIAAPAAISFVQLRRPNSIEFRRAYESQFTIVQPHADVSHQIPRGLTNLEDLPVLRELLCPFRIRPAHLLAIANGEVRGDRGAEITPTGVLIPDEFPGRTFSKDDLRSIKRSRILRAKKAGQVCSLLDPYCHNYFHWFFDVLPRLRELEQFELISGARADLLVPGWMTPWQESSLRMLAPERNWIRHSPQRGLFRLKANQLLVPSTARFNAEAGAPLGAMDPEICVWLRDRFRNAAGIKCAEGDLRLFISRKLAPSRRILNEGEILELLKPHHFRSVCLEEMSFDEQLRLFAHASHVIAAHGSGLTNLLFSTRVKVIELFASGHGVRSDYFQICLALGQDYHAIVSPSKNEKNDFRIDLNQLWHVLPSTA